MNAARHDFSPADQVALGGTDVTISRIGFGTAPLGGLFEAVEEAQATAAVSTALNAGISYFDSAPHYGWGLAEQRLGAALAGVDPRPGIGTKIGYGLRPSTKPPHAFVGAPPLEPFVDWTAAGVERSFNASLERLGVDRVDVLYLHDPNNRDDFDEMIKVGATMARRWQAEGLVGAVGAGMNETDDTLELLKRVELDCVLIAGRVSLLDQSAVPELLPYCQEHNVGVIVGGVFNSGVLAAPEATPNFDYGPAPAEIMTRTGAIRRICEAHDVPLAAAALQYPFRHAAVTAVIPGMRSPEEVEDDLRLFAHEIPEVLWYELERADLIPAG
ncbi:MAG TPA: aldo/keto reductase [Solirubrobacteraceae bacterium]|nr:aldo/keto reductase [Solirubrobacteraceae bacterium]